MTLAQLGVARIPFPFVRNRQKITDPSPSYKNCQKCLDPLSVSKAVIHLKN